MQIYIDGKYYEEEDAKVSVFKQDYLYRDVIFEENRA